MVRLASAAVMLIGWAGVVCGSASAATAAPARVPAAPATAPTTQAVPATTPAPPQTATITPVTEAPAPSSSSGLLWVLIGLAALVRSAVGAERTSGTRTGMTTEITRTRLSEFRASLHALRAEY